MKSYYSARSTNKRFGIGTRHRNCDYILKAVAAGDRPLNNLPPEISDWYQDLVSGSLFEIVAYDEDAGTIEYQLIDGEVGEYDIATWKQLYLTAAEAPEDWRTPFELNAEDRVYSDQTIVPENFSGALSDIEPDSLDLGDDFQIL